MHLDVRGVLTVILLCHLVRGGLLSGPPSNLDQLPDDFVCGHSAVDGQEGIFQSLEKKKVLSANIKWHRGMVGSTTQAVVCSVLGRYCAEQSRGYQTLSILCWSPFAVCHLCRFSAPWWSLEGTLNSTEPPLHLNEKGRLNDDLWVLGGSGRSDRGSATLHNICCTMKQNLPSVLPPCPS